MTVAAPARTFGGEIVPLTSIRGIAALMVVLHHYRGQLLPWLDVDASTKILATSWVWVDFFFVLSGFVIAHVYGRGFAAGVRREHALRFYWIRLARIWPLHLLVLLLLVGVELLKLHSGGNLAASAFTGAYRPEALATSALLVHAWGLHEPTVWNYPSWSISVEWACYLAAPLLLAAAAAWRRWTLALVLLVAWVLLMLEPQIMAVLKAEVGGIAWGHLVPFARGAVEFVAGIALWHVWRHVRMPDLLRHAAFQAGLAVAIVWALHDGWSNAACLPLFLLLILVCCGSGWLPKSLNTTPLHWLGEISYSVYLTHALVGMMLSTKLVQLVPALAPWREGPGLLLMVGIQLVVLLVVSTITYRFVEIPARRWMRNLSAPRLRAAAPAAA